MIELKRRAKPWGFRLLGWGKTRKGNQRKGNTALTIVSHWVAFFVFYILQQLFHLFLILLSATFLCFFHFQSDNPQYLTFYINNIAKRRFINVKLAHSALFLLILQLIMPNKQRNSWLTRYRTKETNKKYT